MTRQKLHWILSGWLLLVALFCVLGTWQVFRYQHKQALLAAARQNMLQPATVFTKRSKVLPFLHVRVSGQYLDDGTLLLQHRFYQHRPGEDVLTPFGVSGSGRVLLVNRGWKALNQPVLRAGRAAGVQTVQGYLVPVGGYQFILGKNILNPGHRPMNIQRLDMPEIGRELGLPLFPFILWLEKGEPDGLVRDWSVERVTAIPPARHLGYAVQWYLMAFVLLVALSCFFFSERKREKK